MLIFRPIQISKTNWPHPASHRDRSDLDAEAGGRDVRLQVN